MPSTAAEGYPLGEPNPGFGVTTSPPVFFVEVIDAESDEVVLDGAEGRHAATVRRLAVGEALRISDGADTAIDGRVVEVAGERLRVAVEVRLEVALPAPEFVVVQALPKGDRGEAAVSLMAEVGVDRIVPWEANRCVTRWRAARGAKSLERWRSAAREASKQSRRLRRAQVCEPATTSDVCALLASADLAIILHASAAQGFSALAIPRQGVIAIVVGPEGGLTDVELSALSAAGGTPIRLGEGILRTSTAGAASVAALSAAGGRWG